MTVHRRIGQLLQVGRLPVALGSIPIGSVVDLQVGARETGTEAGARLVAGTSIQRPDLLSLHAGANVIVRFATLTVTTLPYQEPSPRRRGPPPHPVAREAVRATRRSRRKCSSITEFERNRAERGRAIGEDR